MSEFEIHPPSHGVEVAFEDENANVWKILIIGILSLGLFVLALAFLDNMFAIAREDEIIKMDLSVPSKLLQDMRDTENATLHSYQLLDSSKEVYRIPIDRAMRLIASEAFEGEVGSAAKQLK